VIVLERISPGSKKAAPKAAAAKPAPKAAIKTDAAPKRSKAKAG